MGKAALQFLCLSPWVPSRRQCLASLSGPGCCCAQPHLPQCHLFKLSPCSQPQASPWDCLQSPSFRTQSLPTLADKHLSRRSPGWWCWPSEQVTPLWVLQTGWVLPRPVTGLARVQGSLLLHSQLSPQSAGPILIPFSCLFLLPGYVEVVLSLQKAEVFCQRSVDVLCKLFHFQMLLCIYIYIHFKCVLALMVPLVRPLLSSGSGAAQAGGRAGVQHVHCHPGRKRGTGCLGPRDVSQPSASAPGKERGSSLGDLIGHGSVSVLINSESYMKGYIT